MKFYSTRLTQVDSEIQINFGSYINSLIKNRGNFNEQFVGNVKECENTKTKMQKQNSFWKLNNIIEIRFNSINPNHQTNVKEMQISSCRHTSSILIKITGNQVYFEMMLQDRWGFYYVDLVIHFNFTLIQMASFSSNKVEFGNFQGFEVIVFILPLQFNININFEMLMRYLI